MDNEIFEADYSDERKPGASSDAFDIAVKTGFFKAYSDIMRSNPKVIVPQDKQNYEELLSRLDAFAKRKRGKIKGIVDYERMDAHIYLTMPFFEFAHKDEHELLKDLTSKTNSLTFTVTEDGLIQLSVMINYFEDICDTDDVFSQALNGNDELINALAQSIECRKKAFLNHPLIGKVIEKAASNTGVTPEEFIDNAFDESDHESQMQMLSALLEASDEINDDNE